MKKSTLQSDAGSPQVQPVTPRLLDIAATAVYLSVGVQSVRDWCTAGLIEPVPVPGAALRAKGGRVIADPRRRRMSKLLFDVRDLDRFIEELKRNGGKA